MGEGLCSLLMQNPREIEDLLIENSPQNGQGSVNILKEIEVVQFPRLSRLDLRSMKIESIELISSLFMPNLKFLILTNNYITSLKSLRKIESPNIWWL
jgi:Leucine-rich repeat (LRR) protein